MAMTTTATSQQGNGDNEFHSVHKKKIGSNRNHRTRVYVGNLPLQWNPDELRSLVVQRTGVFAESGVELYHHQDGREPFTGTTQQAFVAVAGMGPEELLVQLRGAQLQGQPLVFQLEQRQRKNVGNNTFTSLSWSKPKVQPQSKARNHNRVNDEKEPKTDGSQNARMKPGTFQAFAGQQSLSALLQDFGAQDAEWQNVQVTVEQQKQKEEHEEHEEHKGVCSLPDNRLERHGKAPIHVEFVSFGYRHGLPSELRAASTGNSYAFPLPEIDSRCLAEIPHFLSWMDGTSGAVRNAMLKANNNNNNNNVNNPHVRDFVRDSLVQPAIQAVISAINEGGHGYAMPLRMTVFVGSEQGRHRAVVACELAATSLRKALRQNENNQFVAFRFREHQPP